MLNISISRELGSDPCPLYTVLNFTASLTDCMEGWGDGVLCGSAGSKWKLVRVQTGWDGAQFIILKTTLWAVFHWAFWHSDSRRFECREHTMKPMIKMSEQQPAPVHVFITCQGQGQQFFSSTRSRIFFVFSHICSGFYEQWPVHWSALESWLTVKIKASIKCPELVWHHGLTHSGMGPQSSRVVLTIFVSCDKVSIKRRDIWPNRPK